MFDNVEGGKVYTGSGPAAQRLAEQMSAAWVAFARTGDPSNKAIPKWTPFTADRRATMVFGAGPDARLVEDPGREERLALKALREAGTRSSAE